MHWHRPLFSGSIIVQLRQQTLHPIPSLTGNFTLDRIQNGLYCCPVFFQTLQSWFPNERQNFNSSEKRNFDHPSTVKPAYSLAQLRRFWCCFLAADVCRLVPCFCTHLLEATKDTAARCCNSRSVSLLEILSCIRRFAVRHNLTEDPVLSSSCLIFPATAGFLEDILLNPPGHHQLRSSHMLSNAHPLHDGVPERLNDLHFLLRQFEPLPMIFR